MCIDHDPAGGWDPAHGEEKTASHWLGVKAQLIGMEYQDLDPDVPVRRRTGWSNYAPREMEENV